MTGDLTRNNLLKGAAASTAALMLGPGSREALAAGGSDAKAAAADFKGKNVVMFITDQERAIQHFPRGWAATNLKNRQRLLDNGLVFENACTNACMCSPARATLLTGLMPAQHQVRHTLEGPMPETSYPQIPLSTEIANIASVMSAAGYTVIWKGKWHLTKGQMVTDPATGNVVETFVPNDVGQYGFQRWNPKDAGANQNPDQGGGNTFANPAVPYTGGANDERFMDDSGDVAAGKEGALAYLGSVAATQQPFFMVISLVNPHDVLFYPTMNEVNGYPDSDLAGTIGLPATVNERLTTKPRAQAAFNVISNVGLGKLKTDAQKREYINFYGNLLKKADAYLGQVLDLLKTTGLLDDTVVIRTSDHGEMGTAHGTSRQKNFNFYEETIRVPLIYSNPKLFPKARTSQALVSHVDFLPTIANLFGAPKSAMSRWQGVDYSKLIVNPTARAAQDYVMFTYDDWQSGQSQGPYVPEPNHIVGIREERWKIARYSDPRGIEKAEWEMYDLKRDPDEFRNLAAPRHRRTPLEKREYTRLKAKLARVEKTRLGPTPGTTQSLSLSAATKQTKNSKTFRFTDTGSITGAPVGSGKIVIDWVLDPAKKTGVGTLTISCGSGLIKGKAGITFTIDSATSVITLTGTLRVISGTGDFRGIRGSGLSFLMTDTTNGQNGAITIAGTAYYR
ncbi:MAG: sulfatase-like hydrolase/transferase [Thermoleophilia bacterium]